MHKTLSDNIPMQIEIKIEFKLELHLEFLVLSWTFNTWNNQNTWKHCKKVI